MDNTDKINNLEKRVERLEKTMREDLMEIKTDLAVIKNQTSNINTESDLKNDIIKKDVENNTQRIDKLESNQKWFILAIIGLFIEAVAKFIFK